MATIATFTSAAAGQALRERGLSALGLAAPMLSPRWSNTTPASIDAAAMTINLGGQVRAPFSGALTYVGLVTDLHGPDGAPISSAGAVLCMHPQAWLRLRKLMRGRYGAAADAMPTPRTFLIRAATGEPGAQIVVANDVLTITGTSDARASFHDARGLALDPAAIAALFNDLIAALPTLAPSGGGAATDAGGVAAIKDLASGVRVQAVDPHGGPFRPVGEANLVKMSGATSSGAPDATGLFDLADGETVAASGADAGKLRFGWSEGGVLGAAALTAPALPAGVTLSRRHLRIVALNADWHILGNRDSAEINGVPGDDNAVPSDLRPKVRVADITYIADGGDFLGHASAIAQGAAAADVLVIASPEVAADLAAPATTGPDALWPAFPASAAPGVFTAQPDIAANISAAWTSGEDVVVTIAGGVLPDGAGVRAYNRAFVIVPALDAVNPSFLRGDGGAALVVGGAEVAMLIRDPFRIGPGGTRPSTPQLRLDVVVTPRSERRRVFGDVRVNVGAGPATAPSLAAFGGGDPFPGGVGRRAISPSPLFGVGPASPPATGSISTLLELFKRLGSDAPPRAAPRAPLMGRLETIVARGVTTGGATTWRAALSGGRLANETRSARHGDGNPGNPAGPDLDAAGLRADGRLAYDLARLAMKRALPLAPLPGGGASEGWLAAMAGDAFNEPAEAGGPCLGAALQSISVGAETPDLGLPGVSAPAATIALPDLLTKLRDDLSLSSTPSIAATGASADRLVAEARREYLVSKHGVRDALPALRRAIREARALIYIESPSFCATGDATHDLVDDIRLRLQAHASLRVIICTPRTPDFAERFGGHVRRAFLDRTAAVQSLRSAAAQRVAVYHPVGYPGRDRKLRSTIVIVDDVWCLVGATHWRRRGLTFDGSAAVASCDLTWRDGASERVAAFRRARMASTLAFDRYESAADQVRAYEPRSAFSLVRDCLEQGGLGRIEPFWTGPTDTSVLPADRNLADPDGRDGANLVAFFSTLLGETP